MIQIKKFKKIKLKTIDIKIKNKSVKYIFTILKRRYIKIH